MIRIREIINIAYFQNLMAFWIRNEQRPIQWAQCNVISISYFGNTANKPTSHSTTSSFTISSIPLPTYFNLTTVLTTPSTIRLRIRLKSPMNKDPSAAAAKATGAKSRVFSPELPSQSEQSRGLWCPSPRLERITRGLCFR